MARLKLRVKRAVCATIGHDWGDWEPIMGDQYDEELVRVCRRCPAYETKVDRDAHTAIN